ncbi:glycoside hydrolase/phage tail family protein [Rhizobiaceae bacterium BDR2-2]|uniref:Glycoside hydrolase/phage tail family protein n=1 Tax=Ectorhizobium quercum TaxID=2965071 RepID=A0AAE3SXG0_9HYPH|nr:glycoside hydrolase/phage tail family protein [Ectorhizobium quercum]MCX8998455.1 glycoside hydrolase/phage tail family protein [Ectorhizobium quercum]
MATILFQAAGAALGSVFGPVGAALGRAAGALAGNMLDRSLIGGTTSVRGSRLATARLAGADEGTAIPRLYGTMRIGGTLIWATRFEEQVVTTRAGGKSGGSRVENFRYYANLAVGLCEGPVAAIRRVWADGREIDLTGVEMRFYRGSEDQLPDPLIEARQGEGRAPAYRGLAYAVFERLPLDGFGNRIPLLQFEVIRPVGSLEEKMRAVVVIPGATEAGYATQKVTENGGDGSLAILNRHVLGTETDWQASIDELQAVCPNLESVALVASWFGTDLRAGHCRIVPGVERTVRDGENLTWQVAGLRRAQAHAVSDSGGGPAYGSTPSDRSVMQAIADLKARGLKVFLYPFVMMDIAPGNGLPDPYGGAEQAAYPWRGRLTCFPPEADATSATVGQVASFCGTAAIGDFSVSGGLPVFTGTDEGYRRMVLHYAKLAELAGGVDGFIIGSEMRGLTTLRDGAGGFPFVSQLAALAADVRAVLGAGAKLTYAADWSEYFGYHPADGSGDVFFHLDPLWAHPAIDAVGIDNYMPLSDWRDEDLATANPDGFRLADDARAMRGQIAGGEGFDWYYASEADRRARLRSPITDGLAGKPWVYRYKDLAGWWSSLHYEREGGAEKVVPTAWVPGSKPLWFTELGCPAIDKGANQPNVFVDPKSAESRLPYFSSGARADSQQRRFLDAHFDHWQAGDPVDPGNIFLWAWDARPYPAFPARTDVWSDGGNWRTGHWLNGRLGNATLADTLAAVLTDHGIADVDVSGVSGDLGGYVQGDVASARDLIEPLASAFGIDMTEEDGRLVFRSQSAVSLAPVTLDVLAEEEDGPLWQETRGHDSDFPGGALLGFSDPDNGYEAASVRSRRIPGASARLLGDSLPAAVHRETALAAVEARLRGEHLSRRSIRFALPPQAPELTAGDVVRLTDGPAGYFRIGRIEEGDLRRAEAREVAPAGAALPAPLAENPANGSTAAAGFAPLVRFLDLPRYEDGDAMLFSRVAALARPWRRITISSSASTEAYRMRVRLERPARMGRLVERLAAGVPGRFDRANALTVDLGQGELSSASELAVLNGANRIAVFSDNGTWEVIGFTTADEIAAGLWRLTGLLRGLGGSEDAMLAGAAPQNAVVVLDEAVLPLALTRAEAGLAFNWIAEASGASGGMAGPFAFAGGLRAETPLSPVHIAARRTVAGDIRLDWTRRGRIDADNWHAADIPLDEDSLEFRVEVLAGDGAVLRSIDVAGTGVTYGAADETADFGSPRTSLALRIRQKGRFAGLGVPAEKTVAVQ